MKVFVTGHRGYIGVHLVDLLKQHGHSVTGCDLNLFDGCEWEQFTRPDVERIEDIRTLTVRDLDGYDCVMHLAAISNDPMGDLNPEITYSINREGSLRLGKIAKEAGVPKFLFSSSCSIYGKGENLDLDEHSGLNPISAYARSKIETEEGLRKMADANFSPVFLRNATAYGSSPMLRIDLVANNLLGCAYARGDIRIHSDGSPWRPLIHCRDIARAFVAVLQSPPNALHNTAVNVGANRENFQVREIADRVKELLPKSGIVYTGEVGADPRDYRVKFDLLNKLLPDFRLEYSLSSGMEDLYKKFVEHKFSETDFAGERFTRLRTLKTRLSMLN